MTTPDTAAPATPDIAGAQQEVRDVAAARLRAVRRGDGPAARDLTRRLLEADRVVAEISTRRSA